MILAALWGGRAEVAEQGKSGDRWTERTMNRLQLVHRAVMWKGNFFSEEKPGSWSCSCSFPFLHLQHPPLAEGHSAVLGWQLGHVVKPHTSRGQGNELPGCWLWIISWSSRSPVLPWLLPNYRCDHKPSAASMEPNTHSEQLCKWVISNIEDT